MQYVIAFVTGGMICALSQILMEKTKMLPGRIMVLLVVTGAVISALGWYEPFQDYAGAGASVPLLGFGNVLMKGVKEAVQEQGFLGLFAGGFKAGAVGTSAALILGYLASLLSKPLLRMIRRTGDTPESGIRVLRRRYPSDQDIFLMPCPMRCRHFYPW